MYVFYENKSKDSNTIMPSKILGKNNRNKKTPDDLPEEIVKEILDVWQYLKTGRAKNIQAKKE